MGGRDGISASACTRAGVGFCVCTRAGVGQGSGGHRQWWHHLFMRRSLPSMLRLPRLRDTVGKSVNKTKILALEEGPFFWEEADLN